MAPYSVSEAFAAIRRAPVLTGLSAAMVGLALLVVGLFGLATYNLRLALETVEQRVEVVAFIRDGTPREEVDLGRRQLQEIPAVSRVRYVDKEEALRIAREDLPEIGELTTDLEVNPFPASFEIQLAEGSRSSETVQAIADDARTLPFVEEVRYGQEWVEDLFLLRRIGAVASAIIGGAFAVVAALIIGTAIRIAVFARRDEIEIMQLVGATRWFIRKPFLLEGALTGLIGGLVALGLTGLAYWAVDEFLFSIEWLPWEWLGLGILAGVLFGAAASGLALRRHLGEV
ncbi:MAG: permease-like cell division protein FtsX [Longimicrobiales bacterium]|nr:permease-like cell division protein FtsX [Longimicrobiales bacterium]